MYYTNHIDSKSFVYHCNIHRMWRVRPASWYILVSGYLGYSGSIVQQDSYKNNEDTIVQIMDVLAWICRTCYDSLDSPFCMLI